MDEGLGKAVKEITFPSSDKQHRAIQAVLELLIKSQRQQEPDDWQTTTVDLDALASSFVTYLEERADFCDKSMQAFDTMLSAIEVIRKHKLGPVENAKFELLEGLALGLRDIRQDQLLDNTFTIVTSGLITSLLRETGTLEPIRKRVGILVPAMDKFVEMIRESEENERKAKKEHEEWLKLHSERRDALT